MELLKASFAKETDTEESAKREKQPRLQDHQHILKDMQALWDSASL
jgi:hypothetical protein